MRILINAFIIGFVAAALPGAVQTTILQSSIVGKARGSLRFALGASIMDGLYLSLAYFGLIQILISFDWLKFTVGILGSVFIGYMGFLGLKDSIKNVDIKQIKNKSFGTGFLLVLLHVPTLLYFVSIATSIFEEGIYLFYVIFASVALSMGAMTCFLLVSLIGKIINKFGSKWLIRFFNISASIALIFFAFKIIWQLF